MIAHNRTQKISTILEDERIEFRGLWITCRSIRE